MLQKRKRSEEAFVPGLKMVEGDAFSEAFPAVFDFLTQARWEDGSARELGTVVLFVEEGRPKVCLSDKDADEVCFVTGSGFTEALQAAEDGLQADGLDWRRSKPRKR